MMGLSCPKRPNQAKSGALGPWPTYSDEMTQPRRNGAPPVPAGARARMVAGPIIGCVTSRRPGAIRVWTSQGDLCGSLGADLLATIARGDDEVPGPGQWVRLQRWWDGRITIEECLHDDADGCPDQPLARVLPIRPPSSR